MELSSDRVGVQSEHDAIQSYLGDLETQGIAEPETCADRKACRDADIAAYGEFVSASVQVNPRSSRSAE